jgi:hypothetical protein
VDHKRGREFSAAMRMVVESEQIALLYPLMAVVDCFGG